MKLNNRGFAITTFMYMMLILAIILVFATLSVLSSRNLILEKQKKIALDNIEQSKDVVCTSVSGIRNITPGAKYKCEVKSGTYLDFYILSTENNNEVINLILDRNICEDGNLTKTGVRCTCAWIRSSKNSSGPIEALKKVYLATKEWTNVPNMNLQYFDTENGNTGSFGYTGVTIINGVGYITRKDSTVEKIDLFQNMPMKARLPKYTELSGAGCTTGAGSCPEWIISYLHYENGISDKYLFNKEAGINDLYGYYTLSSEATSESDAYRIRYNGNLNKAAGYTDANYGVRPVITVPINMIK